MLPRFINSLFIYITTHTYSNLSRLFLRLLTGLLLMQLAINQIEQFDVLCASEALAAQGSAMLSVMIVIELVCATLIVFGLLTRIAIVPPLLIIIAEACLTPAATAAGSVIGLQQLMLPVLFCGTLIFIELAGPGKISLDYILSRYIISQSQAGTEEDEKTLEDA